MRLTTPRRTTINSTLLSLALVAPVLLVGQLTLARASLRVRGPARHAALWQRIYAELPPGWKTRAPLVVREVPDEELNGPPAATGAHGPDDGDGDPADDRIDGDYHSEDEDDGTPATIRLLDSLGERESGMVFAHEYGHFLWDTRLTREERRAYRRRWERQKAEDHLITEYAAEDPEEGFAEAFAYYLRRPARLRERDEASWRYLDMLAQDAERAPEPPTDRAAAEREAEPAGSGPGD